MYGECGPQITYVIKSLDVQLLVLVCQSGRTITQKQVEPRNLHKLDLGSSQPDARAAKAITARSEENGARLRSTGLIRRSETVVGEI